MSGRKVSISSVMLARIRELRERYRNPVVAWDCMAAGPMATGLEKIRRGIRHLSDRRAVAALRTRLRGLERNPGRGGFGFMVCLDLSRELEGIIERFNKAAAPLHTSGGRS